MHFKRIGYLTTGSMKNVSNVSKHALLVVLMIARQHCALHFLHRLFLRVQPSTKTTTDLQRTRDVSTTSEAFA
jgi:hypothetical protein